MTGILNLEKYVKFQAFAGIYLRPSLFWNITWRRLVVTDVSGQPISLNFKGQALLWGRGVANDAAALGGKVNMSNEV